MEKWEEALHQFVRKWENRPELMGVLVAGSFLSGMATIHSDIDIHLILTEDTPWRERGSEVVNGFLIEYTASPPRQIHKYFQDDLKNNRVDSIAQFVTGRIILDKENSVSELKEYARSCHKKDFEKQDYQSINISKFQLWNILEKLLDSYDHHAPDFSFSYHNALRDLYDMYMRFLEMPICDFTNCYNFLNSEMTRHLYLEKDFPDREFAEIFSSALIEENKKEMIVWYKKLVAYLMKKMGGFDIDGWRIRTPLDV